MWPIRSIITNIVLLVILFLGVNFTVNAQEAINTSAKQVTDKTVIKRGQNYTVDGTINGDLYCFGQDIIISAKVSGDVFCAAQTITFSGDIDGSARLAGETVTITGVVSGNVTTVSSNLYIQNSADLGTDVFAAAQTVVQDGSIARDFKVVAKTVTINGMVGRDVDVKNADLTVSETAAIAGNITNNSSKNADIDKSVVLGKINNTEPEGTNIVRAVKAFLLGYAFWFAALMIISFAVLWMFPKPLVNSVKLANEKPLRVTAVGIITVFLSPMLLAIIALTVVGIPLAFLLGLIYLIILCMSGPFFAFLVGSKFIPEQKLWVRMLLGSTIVLIAYSLPFIGVTMALVAAVFGGGMFASLIIERLPDGKQTKTAKP